MNEQELKRFIQHYQRITEQLLETLPDKVDYLFELDDKRKIIKNQTKDKGQRTKDKGQRTKDKGQKNKGFDLRLET
jgi:hypothetical protein